jgi:hypothetical protein
MKDMTLWLIAGVVSVGVLGLIVALRRKVTGGVELGSMSNSWIAEQRAGEQSYYERWARGRGSVRSTRFGAYCFVNRSVVVSDSSGNVRPNRLVTSYRLLIVPSIVADPDG